MHSKDILVEAKTDGIFQNFRTLCATLNSQCLDGLFGQPGRKTKENSTIGI